MTVKGARYLHMHPDSGHGPSSLDAIVVFTSSSVQNRNGGYVAASRQAVDPEQNPHEKSGRYTEHTRRPR